MEINYVTFSDGMEQINLSFCLFRAITIYRLERETFDTGVTKLKTNYILCTVLCLVVLQERLSIGTVEIYFSASLVLLSLQHSMNLKKELFYLNNLQKLRNQIA